MTHRTFSPELCTHIAQWTARADLPALALASRVFHHAVQPILYSTLHLPTAHCAYLACSTLADAPHLGAHVRTFGFYHSPSRRALPTAPAFWSLVRAALECMGRLESLVLVDPSGAHGAVLEGVKSEVLKEVRVRLPWDRTLVAFVQRQKSLRHLQCVNSTEDVKRIPISPGTLPALQSFEGSVANAAQLLSLPLRHMQLFVDLEAPLRLFDFLSELAVKHGSALRGLNLLEVPDEMVTRAIQMISHSCPGLRHLGVISLPSQDRHRWHKHLNVIPLHTLEVIITPKRWSPPVHRQSPTQYLQQYHNHPFAPMIQRMLVTELKMFCPTLKTVILWVEGHRCSWRLLTEKDALGERYAETELGEEAWKLCVDWEGGWNTA